MSAANRKIPVMEIGQVCNTYSGGTPSRTKNEYFGAGHPWIKSGELNQKNICYTEEQITDKGLKSSSAKYVEPNTNLVALYGATAGVVGRSMISATINQAILAVTPKSDELDNDFLFFALEFAMPLALRNLQGAQPNLSGKLVCESLIAYPPTSEQKKIAEILGACDEAIEAQERLIAQKHQRKKGLMQQLLTGKKRFPQFAGTPWREVRLGDVGSVTGAGVDKKSNPEEVPVRLVNYMDVYRNPFITSGLLDHTVTAPEKKANQCSTKKGDVFFTPSSEKPTDIANSAVALEDIPDAVYSYHVVRLRLKEDWDLRFRAYAFTTDEFMRQAERICEGSGTRYVISLEDFRGIKVSVPSKEEQSAISSVLSACDEEIARQQYKLEQLKQQKKGLMQQLLTGKVRVKV